MSEIHNSKKRMPLILKPEDEQNWLTNQDIDYFKNYNFENLKAEKINEISTISKYQNNNSLFL